MTFLLTIIAIWLLIFACHLFKKPKEIDPIEDYKIPQIDRKYDKSYEPKIQYKTYSDPYQNSSSQINPNIDILCSGTAFEINTTKVEGLNEKR